MLGTEEFEDPLGYNRGSHRDYGFEKCSFKLAFKKQPFKLWRIRAPSGRTLRTVQRVVVRGEHDRDTGRR